MSDLELIIFNLLKDKGEMVFEDFLAILPNKTEDTMEKDYAALRNLLGKYKVLELGGVKSDFFTKKTIFTTKKGKRFAMGEIKLCF